MKCALSGRVSNRCQPGACYEFLGVHFDHGRGATCAIVAEKPLAVSVHFGDWEYRLLRAHINELESTAFLYGCLRLPRATPGERLIAFVDNTTVVATLERQYSANYRMNFAAREACESFPKRAKLIRTNKDLRNHEDALLPQIKWDGGGNGLACPILFRPRNAQRSESNLQQGWLGKPNSIACRHVRQSLPALRVFLAPTVRFSLRPLCAFPAPIVRRR